MPLQSRGLWLGVPPLVFLFLILAALVPCSPRSDSGRESQVSTLGEVEVTARLLEIPGPFPPNDLYDYAYVFRYRVHQVHRGQVERNDILVAHYNPLKPRSAAEDEFSGKVGGTLRKFRSGDMHRIALEAPLDSYYMGPVLDTYFNQQGTRYWAIWTNAVTE